MLAALEGRAGPERALPRPKEHPWSNPTPRESLRARFRQIREGAGENWKIRVHRSISWFRHAREFGEGTEARFLFLWIAFNSLYGRWDPEKGRPAQDVRARVDFLRWMCRADWRARAWPSTGAWGGRSRDRFPSGSLGQHGYPRARHAVKDAAFVDAGSLRTTT
jgi:hypothetical protein